MTDDEFRSLVQRARDAVLMPDRESLREAKRARRNGLREYIAACRSLREWQAMAIGTYHQALVAEAAAQRAEARDLRDLLSALIGGAR